MSSPPLIAPQQFEYVLSLTRLTGRLTGKHSDAPTRQRQAGEGPSRDADEQITGRNITYQTSDALAAALRGRELWLFKIIIF